MTDPATSSRKNFGKMIFGAAYGAGVFVIYGWLFSMGSPTFYDKLLCVPVLNLTVRALDRMSIAVSAWFNRQTPARQTGVIEGKLRPLQALSAWTPRQANFGFMGIWVALFGFMFATGYLGGKHPGSDPAFWEKSLLRGAHGSLPGPGPHSRRTVPAELRSRLLRSGNTDDRREGSRNPIGAARSFGRACEIGLADACSSLANLVKTDGDGVLPNPVAVGTERAVSCLGRH